MGGNLYDYWGEDGPAKQGMGQKHSTMDMPGEAHNKRSQQQAWEQSMHCFVRSGPISFTQVLRR